MHSLRHGGATHDFIRGMTIEWIMFRGRWASSKSARHYIQSGRAVMLSTAVPAAMAALAAKLAPRILFLLTLSQGH